MTYSVLFSLTYAAIVSAVAVPAALGTLGTPLGIVVAAAGGVLLYIAWRVAKRSKSAERQRVEDEHRLWATRRAELEQRFETFLGGGSG